ncbi:unnamed protein product, partial [Ectocarpus sp. 13 AM-2016]
VAYKNVIGSRRASWRVISSIEGKDTVVRARSQRASGSKVERALFCPNCEEKGTSRFCFLDTVFYFNLVRACPSGGPIWISEQETDCPSPAAQTAPPIPQEVDIHLAEQANDACSQSATDLSPYIPSLVAGWGSGAPLCGSARLPRPQSDQLPLIRDYKSKIETELTDICDDIL